jgi:hypothetical protein
MAQERPATPEKQLLNLIEGAAQKGEGQAQSHALRYHGGSLFSPGAWKGRFSFFKGRFDKWRKGENRSPIEITSVNHFLLVLLFGLMAYFLIYSYNAYTGLHTITAKGITMPNLVPSKGTNQETLALENPVAYYAEKAAGRDIFKMGPMKQEEVQTKEPSSKTLELAQNLKLVGISWSQDPDAMIEDKKISKTYFVKKGQMVGEALVKGIYKDKVVLEADGEEFQLQ